jgi:hypothetical protein
VTNKPKAIGTRGETAVVGALRALGFPGAERRALAGALDLGDILISPGVIAEVKWGKHAKTASLKQVEQWWDETQREQHNARADLALLIIQRNGIGTNRASLSRCFFDIGALWGRDHCIVEAPLITVTEILRREGWGDPIG